MDNSTWEKLKMKNGITVLKRKPDWDRIKELEKENSDLKIQVEEQADALIELAELLTEGE